MAHDEASTCEMGDTVVIVESQPISRHKRWVVQEIIQTDLSARTESVDELDVDPVAEESDVDQDDVATEADGDEA
jgi:small subunit ribosomal protein S17